MTTPAQPSREPNFGTPRSVPELKADFYLAGARPVFKQGGTYDPRPPFKRMPTVTAAPTAPVVFGPVTFRLKNWQAEVDEFFATVADAKSGEHMEIPVTSHYPIVEHASSLQVDPKRDQLVVQNELDALNLELAAFALEEKQEASRVTKPVLVEKAPPVVDPSLLNREAPLVTRTITNSGNLTIRGVLDTGLDGLKIKFSADGN